MVESRVKICTKILHYNEIMFSSLKHELFSLNGAIENLEEFQHFTLTQRQACEINNVEFQIIQITNVKLKDVENKHKELVKKR